MSEIPKKMSEEDKELLIRGIRPEWMPGEMFKNLRKQMDKSTKEYLKGRFIHISKEYVTETDSETGKKIEIVKNHGPYVKKAEK